MSDKTVVITGGSSGIGEALAYAVAKERFNIILFARREEKLKGVAEKCRELGASMVEVQVGDVSNKKDVLKLEGVVQNFSGEIVLVNNAGIFDSTYFNEVALDVIDQMIHVNLLGVFYVTRSLLPIMLERGKGQVINISSVAAKMVFPGCAVYAASKAGLLAFSNILSSEVRGKGVRVSTVLPGMTHTEIWDHLDETTKSRILPAALVAERIKELIMLPKGITVDEITLTPSQDTL